MGIKYACLDYVIKGWQSDDLPLFGRIKEILVVNDSVMFFHVLECETVGIDRHYHSFSITTTSREALVCLSEPADHHTFNGHQIANGNLYITFR